MKLCDSSEIGLLLSGGLDSAILLGDLLRQGKRVQPFYVECGLAWQQAERAAAQRFCQALVQPGLSPLVLLEMPLADVYAGHWSITGRNVPDDQTPDEAVFLPGRNALLLIKAMVWCQLHSIPRLALAPLGSNPFGDATEAFFRSFQDALNRGAACPVEIVRPYAALHKHEVMLRGDGLPLAETFSCIQPQGETHCGVCNKCAERQWAFREVGWRDPTLYATPPRRPPPPLAPRA